MRLAGQDAGRPATSDRGYAMAVLIVAIGVKVPLPVARFATLLAAAAAPCALFAIGLFVSQLSIRAGAAAVFPVGLPNANGDWVGTSGFPLAPGLDPLADNGGRTRTHRPQAILGILDQGSCSTSYYDQRYWTGATGPRLDVLQVGH